MSFRQLARAAAAALIVFGPVWMAGAGLAAPPAASGPAQRPYTEVPLTPAVIQTFIRTYPSIRPQVDAIGRKYNVASNPSAPDAGLAGYLTATAAYGEMNAAVTPHGYPDFRAWLNTTMTVMFATQWAMGGAQLDAMIAQGQRGGPALPPGAALIPGLAQQQQFAQQGMAALASMKPSQASIDAVRPYAAQIMPLLR
jgi:hypothetical protein